jgi:alcohol dehydrogenase class IV
MAAAEFHRRFKHPIDHMRDVLIAMGGASVMDCEERTSLHALQVRLRIHRELLSGLRE